MEYSQRRDRVGVVLVQLGTPDAPTKEALRPYLKAFLSDKRVVDTHPMIWWPLLNGVILRRRPAHSAALYKSIWREDGTSPLAYYTRIVAQKVAERVPQHLTVVHAMRYGKPNLATVVTNMVDDGITRLLIVPLFPQYAASTTASIVDHLYRTLAPGRYIPALRIAPPFYDHPAYIDAMAAQVKAHSRPSGPEGNGHGPDDGGHGDNSGHGAGEGSHLLFSFHGLPKRHIEEGDPYDEHCQITAKLLARRLHRDASSWSMAYQSRFGREEWLLPATDKVLQTMPQQGVRHLTVLCPGFVSDCLETLEEIAIQGKEQFMAAGGARFEYIPCLNDSQPWVEALSEIVLQELGGWLM